MAINKVVYGGLTLMDLTGDSVTPEDVAEGVTFHDASGLQRTGTASGGGSDISLIETTSQSYNNLPSADKLDPDKLYFLNDTHPSTEDVPINPSSFANKFENSSCMSPSTDGDKLCWTYKGGSWIGANSFRSDPIPSTATKVKFKIVTGTSYSTGVKEDWRVCIGVKADYTTNWINPTDDNWLVKKEFDTRDSTYEDYLDISSIDSECYLMISAHGWTVSFEIEIEDVSEPTGDTKIKYKDISYAVKNIKEIEQSDYDLLPSSKLSDDVLYLAYNDGTMLDPDYTYVKYGDNDEIIIRIYHQGESDQEVLWFFNGWDQTSLDMAIPTELQVYKPTTTSPIFSDSYTTAGGIQTSWFGFYNNNFRSWDLSLGGQYIGIIHAVVNPFPSDTGQQTNGYYSPYVYIQNATPTRRIYLNDHEFSEFNNKVKEVTLSEYIALGNIVNNDGILYCIKDINNEADQYPPLIYSYDEREVGVWTDGKPLYQKTFYLGDISGTTPSISLGLAGIEYVREVMAGSYFTNAGQCMPLPYAHPSNGNIVTVFFEVLTNDVNAQIRIGNSMAGYVHDAVLTVQYTKTADVAGSGIWNQQGGYAHHYSTDEKVVGTWIDGKPLYERTLSVTQSISQNTWTKLIEDANIKILKYDGYWIDSDGNYRYFNWYRSSTLYSCCTIEGNNTNINFYYSAGGELSCAGYQLIIQYTKATD